MVRMAAVLALGAIGASAPALAGDRLALPDGERAADWQAPLAVAGLELARSDLRVTGSDKLIRIERAASGWVLRATDAVGTTRTARVPTPQTDADREEVAHLAVALARDLARTAVQAPTLEQEARPIAVAAVRVAT